jgi:hypothetical protein
MATLTGRESFGEAEIGVTDYSMRQAMKEEVCVTLDVHERHAWANTRKDYSWWKNLGEAVRRVIPENMPRLTVSFDMGWQQRSSGKFNSNSGHAFCIGGYSKNTRLLCEI